MCNRLTNFLESNNILYKHQYGFRKGHSTLHPIIHLLNNIATANDKNPPHYCLSIFLDLSKAFDTLSHNILINKLRHYGVRGIVNDWFSNYLTNRKQYVDLNGIKSAQATITCGVPQGSILGPILFLIYINDISNITSENLLSFADDTTLFLTDCNVENLYRRGNIELKNLYTWLCTNKLSLNINKTKYIIFRSPQRHKKLEHYKLKLLGKEIERVGNDMTNKSIKFLGVHMDEHLTWKSHISYVNKKMSQALFAINQTKNFLPTDAKLSLYYTLVYPHLSYGIRNANKT